MKVLVVGGGGREHALAWKMAQSPKVQAVYVAPGNGGTALDSRLENIAITDVQALRGWAQAEKIALTVVGPQHADQYALPFLRPAAIRREGGRALFVSPGIGTSGVPARLGAAPEISLLNIQ